MLSAVWKRGTVYCSMECETPRECRECMLGAWGLGRIRIVPLDRSLKTRPVEKGKQIEGITLLLGGLSKGKGQRLESHKIWGKDQVRQSKTTY